MASNTIVCPRDNDITVLPSSANPKGEILTGPWFLHINQKELRSYRNILA